MSMSYWICEGVGIRVNQLRPFLNPQHWKVVGDAINSAQITLWASGRKSSQVWKSALTQSLHILLNIISVPMANIIMAKLLKGSAFGITETSSGQK